MNVKARTGSVIHAPHPANPNLPRCRLGGTTRYEQVAGKVTCKRCLAQMATLAQSPDDDDQITAETLAELNAAIGPTLAEPAPKLSDAHRHTSDPRKAAALRATRARERERPAPTKRAEALDALNAKQWIITEERVSASGYVRLTETVITPDRARLNRTLAERFGVPSWRILLATHPTAVHEFSRDGRRITWRFKRPTLAQHRGAFLGELHGLLRAHDWWAVVDAVGNRGLFLGDTAQWRKACEWTAESGQAMPSKPMSEIAQEGYKMLVSAHEIKKGDR